MSSCRKRYLSPLDYFPGAQSEIEAIYPGGQVATAEAGRLLVILQPRRSPSLTCPDVAPRPVEETHTKLAFAFIIKRIGRVENLQEILCMPPLDLIELDRGDLFVS